MTYTEAEQNAIDIAATNLGVDQMNRVIAAASNGGTWEDFIAYQDYTPDQVAQARTIRNQTKDALAAGLQPQTIAD